MLKIEIKTGGSAYSEDDKITLDGRYELYHNLKLIGESILNGNTEGGIMDINGNKVGKWSLS